MRCSLKNRAQRLDETLKRAQELARFAPPELPDIEELEKMEEADRDRLEKILEVITMAKNAEQFHEEIKELNP